MNKQRKAKKPSLPIIEALKEILLSNTVVGTQEEIKIALEAKGYEVNQSKISRLLHKLGAAKTTNEHKEIIYRLPLEPAPPTSRNIISQLITSIAMNECMIVIHTNPGSASLIGRLIDHNRDGLNILGTVAGDDTLFIAPKSTRKLAETMHEIQAFLMEIS